MSFPSDIQDNEWNQDNLKMWSNSQVTTLHGGQLLSLEAKSLHVIGTLTQIFDSVGYLLHCGPKTRPYANYYLYAYLMACTAIELLGRCQTGVPDPARPTLEVGLKITGLEAINVNVPRNGVWTTYTYDTTKLVALRNLAAHGQAVATAGRRSQEVFLHVELLDSFPGKLMKAFDSYYEDLFKSSEPTKRKNLAVSAVEPVLYSDESGQVYVSPMKSAYEEIYQPGKKPSQVLKYTDWQVYNPERDRQL